jgi:hypothetical protein
VVWVKNNKNGIVKGKKKTKYEMDGMGKKDNKISTSMVQQQGRPKKIHYHQVGQFDNKDDKKNKIHTTVETAKRKEKKKKTRGWSLRKHHIDLTPSHVRVSE